MAYTDPQISDFKSRFNRDFPYGGTSGDLTTVQDADIQLALTQQQNTINQGLFVSQGDYFEGALLLAAHFLVLNLRTSAQGIAGTWDWLSSSKGAGGVNGSFQIPDRILQVAEYAILASTRYGTMYLAKILPQLSGQMFTVAGGTVNDDGMGGLLGTSDNDNDEE